MPQRRLGQHGQPAPPPPASRKRQHDDDEEPLDSPAKRQISGTWRSTSDEAEFVGRHGSPPKNVHFKRTLEQGPTKSTADHRHRSPVRSALRHEDGGVSTDEDDSYESQEFQSEDSGVGSGSSSISDEGVASATVIGLSAQLRAELQHNPMRTRHAPRSQSRGRSPTSASVKRISSKAEAEEGAKIDADVCIKLHELQDTIGQLAKMLPSSSHTNKAHLDRLLKKPNAILIRYVGCLALGGPDGKASWQQLIEDDDCRRALVWGVIGRALKENVFGALWFGATAEDERKLNEYEQSSLDKDGFQRTKERAELCASFVTNPTKGRADAFLKAKLKLCLQLERLLSPLWSVHDDQPAPLNKQLPVEAYDMLTHVVELATNLSRFIRQLSDVVYYWPPTFKDEEFEPSRMECLNLAHMINKSPYIKKEMYGQERAVLQSGKEGQGEAIVRVVCFSGLIAYRKGGGELARRQLAQEGMQVDHAPPDVQYVRQTRDGKYTGLDGFRTKVVCKAIVHLQWGKQRLLTKEAGTSNYLDAVRDGSSKYVDDYQGFRELHDIYVEVLASAPPVCGRCGKTGHRVDDCKIRSVVGKKPNLESLKGKGR